MNPLLATALSLAVASVVFLALWWQQPLRITANSLLVHLPRHGTPAAREQLCTESSISVYPSRRRAIPPPALFTVTRRAFAGLSQGNPAGPTRRSSIVLPASGVDWEAPLSATTYQDWHDHQRVREDSITRDGAKLIKLTTMVPSGAVRKESLTVRISDFHPVERTVEFDNNETIENCRAGL